MPRASHSACVKYEGAGGWAGQRYSGAHPAAWRALRKLLLRKLAPFNRLGKCVCSPACGARTCGKGTMGVFCT